MAQKKALVVWGGWDGHTPKESADTFVPFLEESGYEVVVSNTLDSYIDRDLMMSLDLVVQVWTMGEISKEQWAGLKEAIRSGVGFAGFHGGAIDSFRQNTDYQWMTGGQWVAHPGGCIPSYKVEIADADHEITQGIGGFELRETEQYYCHIDPGVHVLCTTEFTGEHGEPDQYPAGVVMPYAWTRQWGEGRVFIASWGHTYKDFDVPEAKQIVERGMLWASK